MWAHDHRIAWLVIGALAGCGRIGFDPSSGGTVDPTRDAPGDATSVVPPGPFGAPTPITALADPTDDDDPALSADGLELFFASKRSGTQHIWVTVRSSTAEAWPAPMLVAALNSVAADKGPGLSRDGLTLYFERGADLWHATRVDRNAPWSAPALAVDLSSPDEDRTPELYDADLGAVLCRAIAGDADIFVATRSSTQTGFDAPRPLVELNSPFNENSPSMAGGHARLYYDSNRAGGSDLYVASYDAMLGAYGAMTSLDELNTPGSGETDPSVSADERLIVFSSTRSGNAEIYEATR